MTTRTRRARGTVLGPEAAARRRRRERLDGRPLAGCDRDTGGRRRTLRHRAKLRALTRAHRRIRGPRRLRTRSGRRRLRDHRRRRLARGRSPLAREIDHDARRCPDLNDPRGNRPLQLEHDPRRTRAILTGAHAPDAHITDPHPHIAISGQDDVVDIDIQACGLSRARVWRNNTVAVRGRPCQIDDHARVSGARLRANRAKRHGGVGGQGARAHDRTSNQRDSGSGPPHPTRLFHRRSPQPLNLVCFAPRGQAGRGGSGPAAE